MNLYSFSNLFYHLHCQHAPAHTQLAFLLASNTVVHRSQILHTPYCPQLFTPSYPLTVFVLLEQVFVA